MLVFTVSKRWNKVYLDNLFLCGAAVFFCSVPFAMGILLVLISEARKAVSKGVNYVRGGLGGAEQVYVCCSFPVVRSVLLVSASSQ